MPGIGGYNITSKLVTFFLS